ncbi:MAG: DEAD/DEAH box helicase family protein [Oligoflexales bacterium]|nr:DEAD/DEAH box helicase family protein [Oligoflexales bacterium]
MENNPTSPQLRFDRGTIVIDENQNNSLLSSKMAVWDERIGALRAPAYRLFDLERSFAKNSLPVSFDSSISIDNNTNGKWNRITLRPYQQEALSSWTKNGHRGIIVLPTGAGKTHLALAAASILSKRTLFLVPTRVLLDQWASQISMFYSGDIGLYGDGERTLRDITVATFSSALRNMPEIGRLFDLLVIDEVHHFGQAVQDELLEMCSAGFRLGLTATPSADINIEKKLNELIGPEIYKKTISDLSGTFLSLFEDRSFFLSLTPSESAEYERCMRLFKTVSKPLRRENSSASWGEMIQIMGRSPEGLAALAGYRRAKALVSLTQEKFKTLLKLIEMHRGSRILIFTADTATAYRLSRFLFIPALTAGIKRKERENYIDAFKKGDITVLISCKVLNEGIDVPSAEIAIILGGSSGTREHVQRIGRILRPDPGKIAVVYELVASGTFEVGQFRKRRRGLDDPNE